VKHSVGFDRIEEEDEEVEAEEDDDPVGRVNLDIK